MKRRDTIIEDLHKIREKIGKAHDFAVRRIAATVRRNEEAGAKTIVRAVPRRPTRHKKAS